MSPEANPPQQALHAYRDYLALLARLHVAPPLQDRIDLSGVIQTTLLEAHQAQDQLRGRTAAQVAAWLRRVLLHNLTDELRRRKADKRDVTRERSLQAALAESSARLERLLVAPDPSPSEQAMQREQLFDLARALAALPENQRRAVEMHHLQGLPLADVARELGCTRPAVAGLLHRALKGLRAALNDSPQE